MKLLAKSRRTDEAYVDFKIRGQLAGITFPCYAEIKYDGHNVTVLKNERGTYLMTKGYCRQVDDDGVLIKDGLYLAEWVYDTGQWDSLSHVKDLTIGQTKIVPFDVLISEGVDVSEKSFVTRREILFHSVEHRKLSASAVYSNKEELDTDFKAVVAAGMEGLVLKNFDETFLMQKWVKMKPPERMTHGSTIDSN
jgi:hypothetical protein